MNVEALQYSVLASILGILIVFLSLCGLSLLMVAIKVVFKERVKDKPAPTTTVSSDTAAALSSSSPMVSAVQRDDSWVMAAVAAFLASEDENSPRVSGWTPGVSESSDPWINRAAFDKKIG